MFVLDTIDKMISSKNRTLRSISRKEILKNIYMTEVIQIDGTGKATTIDLNIGDIVNQPEGSHFNEFENPCWGPAIIRGFAVLSIGTVAVRECLKCGETYPLQS